LLVVGGAKLVVFALLEETPFLALDGLSALLVVAPLDGIAHGRHVVGVESILVCVLGKFWELPNFWAEIRRTNVRRGR
jgi:hypothetical protein